MSLTQRREGQETQRSIEYGQERCISHQWTALAWRRLKDECRQTWGSEPAVWQDALWGTEPGGSASASTSFQSGHAVVQAPSCPASLRFKNVELSNSSYIQVDQTGNSRIIRPGLLKGISHTSTWLACKCPMPLCSEQSCPIVCMLSWYHLEQGRRLKKKT